MGGKLPHQDEQRNDRQIIVGDPGVNQVVQRVKQGVEVPLIHHDINARAGDEHRDGDMHAQGEHAQQAAEANQTDHCAAHFSLSGAIQVGWKKTQLR